jgi:hypothetical protein
MTAFRLAVAMFAVSFGWSILGLSAQAADFAGGWAGDASTCNKIFVKRGGKILFTDDSDSFGSGLIVEENKIIGKLATCVIKSRKEDGAVTHLVLNCSTDVALQTVQFSVRIDNDNKITRLFPGLPELSTPYFRCPL